MTVRWPDVEAASGSAVDAEELFWLKIRPGSVVVDARLKLKVAAGQLRRLQLAVDPCLQLLPLAGPEAPTIQVHTPSGRPQIIELQWAHPIAKSIVLDARFLVTDASSVGNLRLPQLDVLDVRPTRRWLAVSVDAALENRRKPMFAMRWPCPSSSPLGARPSRRRCLPIAGPPARVRGASPRTPTSGNRRRSDVVGELRRQASGRAIRGCDPPESAAASSNTDWSFPASCRSITFP